MRTFYFLNSFGKCSWVCLFVIFHLSDATEPLLVPYLFPHSAWKLSRHFWNTSKWSSAHAGFFSLLQGWLLTEICPDHFNWCPAWLTVTVVWVFPPSGSIPSLPLGARPGPDKPLAPALVPRGCGLIAPGVLTQWPSCLLTPWAAAAGTSPTFPHTQIWLHPIETFLGIVVWAASYICQRGNVRFLNIQFPGF